MAEQPDAIPGALCRLTGAGLRQASYDSQDSLNARSWDRYSWEQHLRPGAVPGIAYRWFRLPGLILDPFRRRNLCAVSLLQSWGGSASGWTAADRLFDRIRGQPDICGDDGYPPAYGYAGTQPATWDTIPRRCAGTRHGV